MKKLKKFIKKIFCSQISWWGIIVFVIVVNPREKLSTYISEDWYLWYLLVFGMFMAWVLFKASHKCKKTTLADILFICIVFCFVFLLCFSSPWVKQYPEEDLTRILTTFTALEPLIVGFATAFFACMQWKVMKEQKNLLLLEKRLVLKNKFESFVDEKLRKCVEPKLNTEILRETYENLTNISGEAFLLFGKNISEKIVDIAKDFEILKTAISYNIRKNSGGDWSILESFGEVEKDISKLYAQITHNKNLLIMDMHSIMREDKV